MSANAPTGFINLYLLTKPGATVSGDSKYTADISLPLKEMYLTRLYTIFIPNLQLSPHEHTMKSSK